MCGSANPRPSLWLGAVVCLVLLLMLLGVLK